MSVAEIKYQFDLLSPDEKAEVRAYVWDDPLAPSDDPIEIPVMPDGMHIFDFIQTLTIHAGPDFASKAELGIEFDDEE